MLTPETIAPNWGLTVLARASRPVDPGVPPPELVGFQASFSPLVAAVAEDCLRQCFANPPALDGDAIAIVLVTARGDLTSSAAAAARVDLGGPVDPSLYFQAIPNAVLGHVAARWALGGPIVCLCPVAEPLVEGLGQAELLLAAGGVDRVLIVLADEALPGRPPQPATALLTAVGGTTC
jgi:hypothetical protein